MVAKDWLAEKWFTRRWLQVALLVVGAAALLLMPSPAPANLLTNDFQAYWGASHLLSLSQDFTDPDLLLEVEQNATGYDQDRPLLTWNPPWFLAWFLPFGAISFERASWLWFLANITLVFASTVMLWQIFARRPSTMPRLWSGLLISFLFMPTLTSILLGQIAALILFGIVAFLWCQSRQRFFVAGVALSLTTIKPHLVYLLLALVLLELIGRKQWRTLAGFVTPLLAGSLVTFMLRPTFLLEYGALMANNRIIYRITVPTPASFLAELLGLAWLQYAGLLALLGGLLLWWRRRMRGRLDLVQLVITTLIVSQLTTAYGWSFDFILFLVPALQVAVWAVEGRIPREQTILLSLLFIAANLLFFYQRSLHLQDKTLVWFPVLLSLLYGWVWWSVNGRQSPAPGRSVEEFGS